jgi:type VI secretion system protein ImpC
MARRSSFASVELDVDAGRAEALPETVAIPLKPAHDDPFRILILGDFSGRDSGGRKAIPIDRDNLDPVLRALGIQLDLQLLENGLAGPLSLRFDKLADFEPDRIFERCDLFRKLSEDDAGASALMRGILHHRDFQVLEASWRALDLVARQLETDKLLKLYILDISKTEVAADIARTRDLRSSELYHTIVAQTAETPGDEAWAVIAGNYGFDRSASDVELLGKLGLIARAAGAPFIAESVPSRDENAADHRAWQTLRRSDQARWIGLAMPRFLLRLPYGKNTHEIDSFDFEEMPARPEHENYLWGNPAFACIYLLGRSFSEYGWSFTPGMIQDIDGLPLHTWQADGETHTQPSAEVLLTDRDAELILDEGLMPLRCINNFDCVRLVRFQSIGDPLAPLQGRWGDS